MARQQLRVLRALDTAKTQLYHFKAIVLAGMGFFTDAYDLFCISFIAKLLGRIYYYTPGSHTPGTLPPIVYSAVTGIALCGALLGQLVFGWLGDKMGRKHVYGLTLVIMMVCSIASGLSFGSFGNTTKGVMTTLCFFRFWLGFGVGGDYPLSATIMCEFANKRTRGAFMAAVFAMQGFGELTGGLVALIVSACFNAAYPAPDYTSDAVGSTVQQADYVWRIIVMVGAIPALVTYHWRMKMPETARYTALVAQNARQAVIDMAAVLQVEMEEELEQNTMEAMAQEPSNSYRLLSMEFLRRHGSHLLGTTTTWFFIDIAYYSQVLFQKEIFTAVKWLPQPETMNAIEETFKIARAQTIITFCGAIPGYWFTVAFIDKIGRFTIQLMGFFMMMVFMLGLAIPFHYWTENNTGFLIMYTFTFFFANFGPNTTTFVVPAELFPARFRSTCHGISAAAGKAGAIVGAFGFLYASQSTNPEDRDSKAYPPGIGMKNTLLVLAAADFLGMVFTLLYVPETKGKSLEEISGDADHDDHENPLPPGILRPSSPLEMTPWTRMPARTRRVFRQLDGLHGPGREDHDSSDDGTEEEVARQPVLAHHRFESSPVQGALHISRRSMKW